MFTKKIFVLVCCILPLTKSLPSQEQSALAVVNFATCITESKFGKQEQENLENMRKQMSTMSEETKKELDSISAKFEDADYMDGLSPKAEEELRTKYQALNEDLARYQQQFYQVSQQASYQLMQKMNEIISKASHNVALSKKLTYVVNREACFYYKPESDITQEVIKEMDREFSAITQKQKAKQTPVTKHKK